MQSILGQVHERTQSVRKRHEHSRKVSFFERKSKHLRFRFFEGHFAFKN